MAIPVIDPADEATRHLASAVHLDDEFADLLVEEYLAEPKRAIPPSPGVRAEIVLREAVAAQARRRIISAILLVLLLGSAAVNIYFVWGWLVSGLAWRIGRLVIDWATRDRPDGRLRLPRRWQRWWATAVLWTAVSAVFGFLSALPLILLAAADKQYGYSDAQDWSDIGIPAVSVLPILFALVMYGLLVTQAYLRRRTAETWFGYGNYQPNTPPRDFVVRACGPYADRLRRIGADDARRGQGGAASEVVVFRGHNPFVGAGTLVQNWSVALELHTEKEEDGTTPLFSPAELQDFIAADMESLRATQTLTPGARFTRVDLAHWATLSARHMLHYPAAAPLLEQLESGANPTLSVRDWVGLIDSSPEWLRYFRCYRVEGWERQLGVSGFLHVGCDNRTLYLEWNGYVLPPVADEFRAVDDPPRVPELRAIWQAVGELALLPTTVPGRIIDLVRALRDAYGIGRGGWRTPNEATRVYGAAASLRELGAGDSFTSFFEEADSDRYLKIMERRIFDAVHRFLISKGVSTSAFDSIVAQINNSTVLNNCNVIAGNVGGQGNVGTVGAGSGK